MNRYSVFLESLEYSDSNSNFEFKDKIKFIADTYLQIHLSHHKYKDILTKTNSIQLDFLLVPTTPKFKAGLESEKGNFFLSI
jgi:hypothetical protein